MVSWIWIIMILYLGAPFFTAIGSLSWSDIAIPRVFGSME